MEGSGNLRKDQELGFRRVVSSIELKGKLTSSLFKHWTSLRAERELPHEDDFDYLECPDLISTLVVADVIKNGKDFQTRFFGATLAEFFEVGQGLLKWSEVEARTLDNPEVHTFVKNSREILTKCVIERSPVANGPKKMSWGPKNFVWFESLCVPFENESGDISRVVAVVEAEASLETETQ
jgi:hypothetical protein